MKLSYVHSIMLTMPLLLAIYCCNAAGDPTLGFTEIPLNKSNFFLQKPYDVPLDQRYSFIDGVHRMWVYADDKPHFRGSISKPRTEILIAVATYNTRLRYHVESWRENRSTFLTNETGLNYKSGVWQFEGYGFVPNGTSGATVAQIHGSAHRNTTMILRVYAPGEMRYYSYLHVADGLYDRWFRLNMIHDVDGGKVTVFLDGEQKFQYPDHGPGNMYFKCGVYAASANISYYMESMWRNIKIYRK